MYSIVRHATPREFLAINGNFIYSDYFRHYHLINVIDKLHSGATELHDYFSIVEDGELRIFVLWTRDGYYIYGRGWGNEVLPLLSERIGEEIERRVFCGESELIKALFRSNQIDFEVFKNRLLEECREANPANGRFTGEMAHAEIDDSEEIIQMELAYYREEFRGGGRMKDEGVAATAMQGIIDGTIFTWRVEDRIVGIISIINDDQEQPMLGSLFTKPDRRGNGYAYFLLHTLTSRLLETGSLRCGLVADQDNNITSRVFLKVGYQSIYRWCSLSRRHEDE
ncbi:GNAT family N-acetyltransferase [Chryseolinea lacunae]|uniref:GNAT family N-acetyltransferase n=1 Tax=Chryseolinea lacunae TaxID=2801331 RepID=A0ABS1L3R5_9BACT|nr:GNAT family N-acetyltransferase [Chryseolinea lacunae]MBL0745582.1 GNAT family N-acetyltransferase [Chryseolinea lacunae]